VNGTTRNGTTSNAAPQSILSLLDAGDPYWSPRTARAMGSRAELVVGDAPSGVVDWALTELERLEQCWSRFRPDSELSRLNTAACDGAWTDVSASMLLALTCALDLHYLTAGRFDPTVLDALERAGYDRTFELVPPELQGAFRAIPAPGFAPVEIDEERSRVRLPPGTRIDLGGVGKGLAADLVARGLVDRGARTALVSMGGDMRARGEPPPAGAWDIPVLDPFDETRVAFRYPLTAGAIVTSTTRIRSWTRGGRSYHHLIDPATGDSARGGLAAAVVAADEAWHAEGLAKAIIIGGADQGGRLADDTGVHAWLFHDDGRVVEHGDRIAHGDRA
jgi:thiamine biosynthesis lipoprotein